MSGVAVLMACRNRRKTTMRCLECLMSQLDGKSGIFLLDDGSTDGTGDAVRKAFPQVSVIDGDGSLYWASGMRKAWEIAISGCQNWDGYIWLNDDTELRADAVERLFSVGDGEKIVVGELENSAGEIVYGLREGGFFTGNCVLVPSKAYKRLGMICGDYSHAWADYDYAAQAKRAGIGVVSAGVVGKAEWHPNRPGLMGMSLKQRLLLLRDPKGWNLHDLWLYRRRNWGIAAAVVSCMHLVLHVILGER